MFRIKPIPYGVFVQYITFQLTFVLCLSHVYLSLFCIVLIFTNSFFFYLVAVIMPPVALAHTSIILSWSGHCLCYCTLCKN